MSLMLIRDYYFEDASRQESKNHKWCIFLCPTQELVYQQARSAQIFTGVRCGEWVGRWRLRWFILFVFFFRWGWVNPHGRLSSFHRLSLDEIVQFLVFPPR